MAYTYLEARTRNQALALSNRQLELACQRGGEVRLVVPAQAWVQSRKAHLLATKQGGVRVQTYGQMLAELWDVYGDGSRLVSSVQRALLARPLLSEMMGTPPSQSLLSGFCAFLEEAVVATEPPAAKLKEHEQQLCALVGRYAKALQEHGLVEAAQAEAALLESGAVHGSVVVEEPDTARSHALRFFEGLGQTAEVALIARSLSAGTQGLGGAASHSEGSELAVLSERLYTGVGKTLPTGQVLAGEAHGSHVEGELLVKLIQAFMAQGAQPEQIAIVFQSAADSYPHVQDALAQAQIPFTCAFSVPFKSTPFGAAFLNLVSARNEPDDDKGYRMLSSFAASPYAGIEGRDARALQMRWRMRAGSTRAERLKDITSGFAQGNAERTLVQERLLPLAQLLEADHAQLAVQMFENAKAKLGAGSPQLADDARAADALLDYLDECSSLSCEACMDGIAHLPVAYQRACVSEHAGSVSILGARSLALSEFPYVVLANLDARHYPMARSAGPFDGLLSKMGVNTPDTQALRMRCLLLDALGAAHEAFGFYRVCHDASGDEVCQSALWDELLDAYHPKDVEGGSGHHVLAEAGALVELSEAAAFAVRDGRATNVTVSRGGLVGSTAASQLTQYPTGDAIPFSPTALEDYYRCPYRWFTSRRVGYNSMDNSFSAAAQGNLAHEFFEKFYREFKKRGHKRVTPQNLEDALGVAGALFDGLVQKGLNKPKTGLFLKGELDRLNCDSIREQVCGLLTRDAHFLPGFEPTYLELELGRGTGSTLMYAGVPVRGKVDRIDVDAEGRAVVIDYKLSSLSSGYGLSSGELMPQRIQTDIYAVLVQRHFKSLGLDLRVVGSVYRSYSSDTLRGVYESGLDWGQLEKTNTKYDALPSASCAMGYPAYLEHVEEEVASLLGKLSEGDIEPRPIAADICEYCKALQFCPVGGRS